MLKIEEHDLLWFFETEPEQQDQSDTDWITNNNIYHVSRNGFHLKFLIDLLHERIEIVLKQDGFQILEIDANTVKDVCFLKETKKELLKIDINNNHSILIQIKPQISIVQTINEQFK